MNVGTEALCALYIVPGTEQAWVPVEACGMSEDSKKIRTLSVKESSNSGFCPWYFLCITYLPVITKPNSIKISTDKKANSRTFCSLNFK